LASIVRTAKTALWSGQRDRLSGFARLVDELRRRRPGRFDLEQATIAACRPLLGRTTEIR
jgi:hypothetical protein